MKLLPFCIVVLFLVACTVQQPTPATPVLPTPESAPIPETDGGTPTVEKEPTAPVTKPTEPKLIYPTLTYEGAYNGPLYETSFQAGDSGPMDLHFANMDRNGVSFTNAFFGVAFPPKADDVLLSTNELGYALNAVKQHPGRIVPFYSQLLDPEETDINALAKDLDAIFQAVESIAPGFLKGIGEIPQMDLPMKADSVQMRALADIARKHNIMLMFHPPARQVDLVKNLIEAYPDVKFFMHMYAEDVSADAAAYGELIKDHDNLYFSIDADHMMFLDNTGLLYKYEGISNTKQAATYFVSDYDSNEEKLLKSALARYAPLIKAAPDRVMWGTEMGPAYNYEPEVYDRMIKFTRKFIAKLSPEVQEKFAYKNALAYFGPGITYTKNVQIIDSSSWPACGTSQASACDSECDNQKMSKSEVEPCLVRCFGKLQCIASEEED